MSQFTVKNILMYDFDLFLNYFVLSKLKHIISTATNYMFKLIQFLSENI